MPRQGDFLRAGCISRVFEEAYSFVQVVEMERREPCSGLTTSNRVLGPSMLFFIINNEPRKSIGNHLGSYTNEAPSTPQLSNCPRRQAAPKAPDRR